MDLQINVLTLGTVWFQRGIDRQVSILPEAYIWKRFELWPDLGLLSLCWLCDPGHHYFNRDIDTISCFAVTAAHLNIIFGIQILTTEIRYWRHQMSGFNSIFEAIWRMDAPDFESVDISYMIGYQDSSFNTGWPIAYMMITKFITSRE